MKGKHRSFLKRVLDAFDGAEETWRERHNVKPSMNQFASPSVQTRIADFVTHDESRHESGNVNCDRLRDAWRPLARRPDTRRPLMFTPSAI